MLRATRVIPARELEDEDTDLVLLDFDGRHRRRIAMTSTGGVEFLLDLPEAVALGDGDGLGLEDGRVIRVCAKPERVADIRADSHVDLVRIAWHLGNRHLPTQILDDCLRIRDDHVITDMVRRLGGTVHTVDAPFQPEGGAYGHAHEHEHEHER